jgi:hypothetical protein
MNNPISRFRISPAVVHKETPSPKQPESQTLDRPQQHDTPARTSIEVGGDTPPPGPSGLRDGFEEE